MTTLREAAQQALEALETNRYAVANQAPHLDVMEYNAAITSLRAALAQQDEPVEPVAWLYEAGADRTLHWHKPPLYGTPLYLAPPRCPNCSSLEAQNTELDRKLAELEQAETAQEPVAWLIAQRDALLEALKDATKTIEHLGYPLAAIERARAAIKAVEGEKA